MAHKSTLKRKSYADFGNTSEDGVKIKTEDNTAFAAHKASPKKKKYANSGNSSADGVKVKTEDNTTFDAYKSSPKKKNYFGQTSKRIDDNDNDVKPVPKDNNIGRLLMSKMGYREGQGLGKDSQGNVDVIADLSGEELRRARSTSNPFETIEKGMFQNRAAMKMANMDAVFGFMFTEPTDESSKPLVKQNELLYFADICSGPGGFSEYVLWRKGWTAKGFGLTLKGANDFKLDEFFAGSAETFEPHYGDKGLNGNGDIYEPQNLIAFRDFVLNNSDKGVHFVMADGGFSVEGDENNQEILSKRLYLCQFLCSLALLKTNGSFVCKLFDIFTPFSVGLIYLMYRVFKKVCIHKPNSSRPANSERYIICKWKKCGTEAIEHYLFKLNCHLDYLSKENTGEDIIEVVPSDVLMADEKFCQYMTESNNYIGKRQIVFLSKVKAFAENPQLDLNQPELRKECLKYWKVDVKTRVAPFRGEASHRFQELISKPNETKDYFAYKPKLLEEDNVQELDHILGFKCMILGADNDCNSSGANSFTSVRGFFMGLGRTHIYYWDGSSSSKWIKFEAKFELSPSTLLYGEYVQELKGEGKAQRRIAAFHIIDPLFIGGTDVRNKCFEERVSLATKFAKAVNKSSQPEYAAVRMKRVYDLQRIHQIFLHMDMKECKSGAQKVRLCYELNSDERFIIPFGLLIVNTVKQPWIVRWSRSQGKPYYFNLKTGSSLFDFPADSLADFRYTFSNRMLWKWESDKYLMEEEVDSDNKLSRHLIESFVNKRKP
ncbi:unnamed protein product [Medioppia subpectinata]|uniref:Cap-specific mRNA (nucleoside-2'-O-)-methyltransferase 1 n=1 Tax=Medioppia subpectinata TaxID=1979941 RepID=A0A7R9Q1J2_9ACAR|nr:unnamed protein product [Medioppia subpectinata]CAG2108369.1 unnamed protein product [Medioppia subpectinata]